MATRAPFCSVKKSAASEKVALPSLPKKNTQRQMSARFADRLNFSVKIGTFPNNSIVYSSVFTSFFSKLPAAGRHYYGWTAGIQKTKGTCRLLAWPHFLSAVAEYGRHGNLIFSCLLFVLFEKICSIKSCHFANHGILIKKTKLDGFLIFSIAQCTMAIMSSFFQ